MSMDKEWCKKIETRICGLEKEVSILKERSGLNGKAANGLPEVLELDLALPRMDVGGLHFNRQEGTGGFDLKDDGWYHCRNILFLSARNTEDDNSRDILSEYLESEAVRDAFAAALRNAGIEAEIAEISLPSENGGVKKYNGVDCWYWINDRYSGCAATFCLVNSFGDADGYVASSVGGCAPVFRTEQKVL